jgi:ketosteroid isomerase-like protein
MKKMIPCLILVSLAITMKAQTTTENVEVVKRIFKSFNQHNWAEMISYYSAEAVFEDPAFVEPVRDLKFIQNHHQQMQEYFPNIYDDVKNMYPSGDNVVVEFVSIGTSIKGEKLSLPICTVLTFRNGKVIRDATYYDNPQ